jgi:DNA helicase-2/ATP-dependent DNA helicase PcrA
MNVLIQKRINLISKLNNYLEKLKILENEKNNNKKYKKYENKIFDYEERIEDINNKLKKYSYDDYIKLMNLNKQQLEIVKSNNKIIRVIACPGSGKTHTTISRYLNLVLHKRINPNNIILITFTKKAGKEMLTRIQNIIPQYLPYYVGSLHGLAYKILNNNHTILDENDSRSLLKSITIKHTDIKIIIEKIYTVYNKVCNNNHLTLYKILKRMNIGNKNIFDKILKEYKITKKQQNILDFNDLMNKMLIFLNTKKGKLFLENIKYIFFDEFQDINPIQNTILEMFREKSNIMVVGDDCQSIYSFRDSCIDYILNFKCDKTYHLEYNYRSTPEIVNLCENIIIKNTKRINKNVTSMNNSNIKPNIKFFNKKEKQYEWVIDDIKNKYNNGINLNKIAILSRFNKYSLENIERLLINKGIKFNKISGNHIIDHDYIKHYLTILSYLVNNKNNIAYQFLLNNDNNINSFINNIKNENYYKQLILIRNYINIKYKEKKLDKNLNIIINYLSNYDNLNDGYNNIYLNFDNCSFKKNAINLSTIHGSKGLEWEYVYLIDYSYNGKFYNNIFYEYYTDAIDYFEEERRLFYVACSRAEKHLYINYVKTPNIFIKEICNKKYNSNKLLNDIYINDNIENNIKNNGYTQYMKYLNLFSFTKIKLHEPLNLVITKELNNIINNNIKKIICNKYKNDYIIENIYNKKLENINWDKIIKNIIKIIDKNYNIKIIKNDIIDINNNLFLFANSNKTILTINNLLKLYNINNYNNIYLYNCNLGLLYKKI